jgi:hypothetical protein
MEVKSTNSRLDMNLCGWLDSGEEKLGRSHVNL